tara:strand:+ start:2097 stop:2333 length:237 start_codon:yes stop_codon:yes gene_type:complete
MKPEDERYDAYISRSHKEADAVAEKLPGIINLIMNMNEAKIKRMSQNILTNLEKIRHLEARIQILEQRNLHSAENNNY